MASRKRIFKVRIGDDLYQVLPVADVEKAAHALKFGGVKKPRGSREIAGMVDLASKTILIDRYLSADEKDSTLLHEVLHVILPRLSEKNILKLESKLFPILNENGFRFIDRRRNLTVARALPTAPAEKRPKKGSLKAGSGRKRSPVKCYDSRDRRR